MELDLRPYDAATREYQDAERETVLLRAMQCVPEGERLSEADLVVVMQWITQFQHLRDLVALALKGVVDLRVANGEVALQARTGQPLASLAEMEADAAIDESWVDDRADVREPDDPTQR